jgi:DMSO/TMAO reductase YedYZ molybdopterin-dependent catalytic subunit
MKKLSITLALILFVTIIAACSSSLEVTKEASSETVLEIIGLEESKSLTMADLQAMNTAEGWGGTKSSAGVITPPQQLKGMTIMDLAALVGGLEPGMGVNVVAKDGYGMTMSYEQIAEGGYITYDPGTGNENEAEGFLQTIVAFERDGEPIPSDEDGPLRLFIVSEKNDNVVDGHWTVKWVTKIELKPMSEEWTLYLEGALTEEMDRNSFFSF